MQAKTGIVYLMTNKVNGMCYVGQTVQSLDRRMIMHNSAANALEKTDGCSALNAALREHGKGNFSAWVLWEGPVSGLNLIEIAFINHIGSVAPNGYNLDLGGDAGCKSEQTRAKMRATAQKRNGGKFDETLPMYLCENRSQKAGCEGTVIGYSIKRHPLCGSKSFKGATLEIARAEAEKHLEMLNKQLVADREKQVQDALLSVYPLGLGDPELVEHAIYGRTRENSSQDSDKETSPKVACDKPDKLVPPEVDVTLTPSAPYVKERKEHVTVTPMRRTEESQHLTGLDHIFKIGKGSIGYKVTNVRNAAGVVQCSHRSFNSKPTDEENLADAKEFRQFLTDNPDYVYSSEHKKTATGISCLTGRGYQVAVTHNGIKHFKAFTKSGFTMEEKLQQAEAYLHSIKNPP